MRADEHTTTNSDGEDGQLLLLSRGHCWAKDKPQLTVRAVIVGLLIGTVLCFTNMFFGLQTGWVTMGSLQSAMVGFGILRYCWPAGRSPFNPLENVVVQTIGVATATMPLAGGFVGIIPALQLLDPPVRLSTGELFAWCAALTYFGIFFAVPLRRQTILVEKLPFPSGTATAKLIECLHARTGGAGDDDREGTDLRAGELRARWRALGWSFALSFGVALVGFFVPPLANLRIFSWVCLPTLSVWHWTLRPSLSYVGQGIIMGPRSAFSMLAGALASWALLGPLAVAQGWVASVAHDGPARSYCSTPRVEPATIDSWEHGAQGWTLWVAMGLMLAEAVTSFALIVVQQLGPRLSARGARRGGGGSAAEQFRLRPLAPPSEAAPPRATDAAGGGVSPTLSDEAPPAALAEREAADVEVAAASELVPVSWWVGGLVLSIALCVAVVAPLFRIPAWQLCVSAGLSCLIAVLAVRALGQTDLNPVSAVGKLSQIIFTLLAPGHVVTNIVAGAMAEAGAMQAGDLMQDLKTGHLLRASPRAQFYGQLIGSTASIIVTVSAFRLYADSYGCQSAAPDGKWDCEQFKVPVAHVWKDMAILMQSGISALPPSALGFAGGFALLGALLPVLETYGPRRLHAVLPSGIAFGIGMYLAPEWTLPRVAGSVLELAWRRYRPASHRNLHLMVASGFVLGEGVFSIVGLALRALKVPTL